jgi:hypothetical protein
MNKIKVLIYGDSLCYNLPINCKSNETCDINIEYDVESFPGKTVEWMIKHENEKNIHSLTHILNINKRSTGKVYDVVILCAGINDIENGSPILDVIKNLLILQSICRKNKIKNIVATFLYENYDEFNRCYELLSKNDINFCEFFLDVTSEMKDNDNLHLNEIGKKEFVNYLNQFIRSI